jgi:drug/metabolite transporter (DMT)-like permease
MKLNEKDHVSVSKDMGNIKNIIKWLRISYWSAAIGDFFLAILILVPQISGNTHYSVTMGMMAGAAFSWGIIMIFADRKPIERRWILLPTILVGLLLAITNIHAISIGESSIVPPLFRVMPFLVNVCIWIYSYLNAMKRNLNR